MKLRWVTVLGTAVLATLAIAACGSAKPVTNPCSSNVAIVSGTDITRVQYRALLRYTLGFYEHGNSASPYYGKKICSDRTLKSECASVKTRLRQRMIDQTVVSNYAAAHNLLATPGDWTKALQREHRLIQAAGGDQAFLAYLKNVGSDEAQFRFLEGQEIETAKVIKAIGTARFRAWLKGREASDSIKRCPV
jgi:hypothetical protein